jgi:hypothetical protein
MTTRKSLQATEEDYARLQELRWIYKTEMMRAIDCYLPEEKRALVARWKEEYSEATYNELMKLAKQPKYRNVVARWDLGDFDKHRIEKEMNFNQHQFYKFCSQLRIETKEHGLKKMGTLLGTQTYVMDEITKGLEDDIHHFVILKGRQLGITTISLALDLYWHFTHPGLQGTLTTDTEENRDMFRTTLAMYMEGLPKEYRIPLLAHNRNQLSLKNRSRLFYQVAGLRAKGSLGRGKAITYLHGTETSSWGDEEGLASLLASLAETNPSRLYLLNLQPVALICFTICMWMPNAQEPSGRSSVAGGVMNSTWQILLLKSTVSTGMANSNPKKRNGYETLRSCTG